MDGCWGTSEPTMIDEKILQEAVVDQLPQLQAKHIAKAEGINFSSISKLRLNYRNIVRIDHLWEFTSLVRLDLNTNLIEKIEGLERLVNLTWLNLSFNRIEKIEGLESLGKLQLMNLNNNRISVLENMDTLKELTNFSIAGNRVGELDNVLYLRKFKKLYTLNLSENPVTNEDDYRLHITAYFPHLTFLDCNLIDQATRDEAYSKYHIAAEKHFQMELQIQEDEEAEQKQQTEFKLHMDAFVEYLNGSYLFKSMFSDDPEAEMLLCVPGVHQMVDLCMQLFETGLSEHERRQTEVNSFFSAETKAMTNSQQQATQIIVKFEQQQNGHKISHYNEELNELCDSLMALEFHLVCKLEVAHQVIHTFALCRELEDRYHEKLSEVAQATLDNVAKDTLEVDMPEDVKILFTDRDMVLDALTGGHDNRLLKINDRETQLVSGINAWKVALIEGIQEKELQQNRMRISGIYRYVEYLKKQLEDFK
uniref:Dynein regulatory complex subunit 3 n=1 Tax=Mola mola TaxID=94237 RepID=A0A3Q3W139_MOLML